MKTVFHDDQRNHYPKTSLFHGVRKPNREQPERIDALLGGVAALGGSVIVPDDNGIGPIAAVHSAEYLTFLKNIYARWREIDGASDEVTPNVHPDRRTASYPASPVGQAGYHMADTACPISADTWNSAYWSAQTAVSATNLVLDGERSAYALCRPPGHHAFSDLAGGFCYFNNAAIAAQHCLAAGARPAIVDIDLHHGNGTQGIFYQRGDVLTVSVHVDPNSFYPFFWGHTSERGADAGMGANFNLPLPVGSGDAVFLEALRDGLARVEAFGADVLIISLGLDAFEGDPFAGLGVTTPGFARIAETCAGLNLPTVIVQEGGYLCPELGENLTSFLGGFAGAG